LSRRGASEVPHEVEFHIEELVLHGYTPSQARRVGMALQSELERLLAGRGLPESLAASAEIPRIDAGQVRHPASAGPEATGVDIARAIHGGLNYGQ
jgi:plasmid stabilization system protein ParE